MTFFQINYCGPNANCNNHPGFFECNEDDCKDGYTNWQANKGISDDRDYDGDDNDDDKVINDRLLSNLGGSKGR